MKSSRKIIRLHKIRWVFGLSAIVVIGGIMSFGLVSYTQGLINNRVNSLAMLGMIIPMTAVIAFGLHFALRSMEKRLIPLLEAIERVADGDLDVELNESDAGEYEQVYAGFNRMTKELRATKSEMDSFINTFAHEFKTPVTAISGFADYLYETGADFEDDERMEYLKMISDESQRLVRLSHNALILSKAESLQVVTEKERFSLSEQIRRCVIMMMKEAEKKNITIELPEDDTDIFFNGNAELIEHIWINLLSNALKFTDDGGTVSISEVQKDKTAIITFTDTGVGMTEDTMQHIFEKYYQHDTKSIVKGNGIGLALVKRIAILSGGSVSVRSTLGKGSSFTVTLKQE